MDSPPKLVNSKGTGVVFVPGRVPGTPYLIIIVSYVWCPRNPCGNVAQDVKRPAVGDQLRED